MSYTDYDSRYQYRPRQYHVSAMSNTPEESWSPSSHYSHSSYAHEPRFAGAPPPPLPHRPSAAYPQYRPHASRQTWPPLPSVEDETVSLDKEVPSKVRRPPVDDGEPPMHTKGTVDQEILIEDIERPDDHRFVLVSDPISNAPDDHGNYQRSSFAQRVNMAPIKTEIEDPPVFTERISTPYAYTKSQKTSTAPEPLIQTPVSASTPRFVPSRDSWNLPKDQMGQPSAPAYSQRDSFAMPSQTPKNDLFDDSDLEPEDISHLRTAERKPARYSFVKSELQKEDLRTNIYDSLSRQGPKRGDSDHPLPPKTSREDSISSSKGAYSAQSPRSSSPSVDHGNKKPPSASMQTGSNISSKAPSRPSSPVQRAPSPIPPSRLRDSPPNTRPASRGNTRPTSPLSFTTTVRPPSPWKVSVTDSDWHATYPPPIVPNERSRPPSRIGRHETMPIPAPRIDVQSPSPVRQPIAPSPLPYPLDDRPADVFMPSEEHYQFDHSTVSSPQQLYSESPRAPSSPMPGSPRLRDESMFPIRSKSAMPENSLRTRGNRSDSLRSQANQDGRRERTANDSAKLDLDKPLPSCPRSVVATRHNDWYSLKGYRHFDICPSCYESVFRGTPFAIHFAQNRLAERPIERVCDFSSPWVRLAWLLTIKQRLSSFEKIYSLADVTEIDRPCPEDRELGSDRILWYGIPDQRDGVHVANFAICSSDKRMIEALFPTLRSYFTKLPSTYSASIPKKYMCSLRTSSSRFPRYLDLLVELDGEAQDLSQRPNIDRFIQMARENAFKNECARDKSYMRKAWHFIPSLPEFTVCEECYDKLVWPAMQSRNTSSSIPRLFNKSMQLVPNEDPDIGSSCCLYSPRMRKVWDISVKEDDYAYLKRKALERKKVDVQIARQRKSIINWMMGLERGSIQWERGKSELKELDREWAACE